MVALLPYVRSAWAGVRDDAVLLALPVLGTVLQFGNVSRVLAGGPGGGINFRFPSGFATLWTFAQVPPGEGVVVRPVSLLVGVLVQAVLTTVYVPRVVERVRPGRGEAAVSAALSRYFAPLLAIGLVNAAIGIGLVLAALVAGPLVLLAIPVVLALGYALYAAPFLVVVAEESAVDALARSVDLAFEGGPYASYGLRYLGFVAVVSIPVSTVVRFGVGPLALAAVATAPVAAAVTGATAAFVTDLVDGDFDGGDVHDDERGFDDDESPFDGGRGNHWAREETDEGTGTGGTDDDATP